ncbi:hypothetical protein BaRGS_00014483 [Batillaria attramentaria]|uniref:Uncharacterized protein n=1 Tax=Batillaria attramentaria TaxID=370345 RepID=A0ABD0L3V0_9CAEN
MAEGIDIIQRVITAPLLQQQPAGRGQEDQSGGRGGPHNDAANGHDTQHHVLLAPPDTQTPIPNGPGFTCERPCLEAASLC